VADSALDGGSGTAQTHESSRLQVKFIVFTQRSLVSHQATISASTRKYGIVFTDGMLKLDYIGHVAAKYFGLYLGSLLRRGSLRDLHCFLLYFLVTDGGHFWLRWSTYRPFVLGCDYSFLRVRRLRLQSFGRFNCLRLWIVLLLLDLLFRFLLFLVYCLFLLNGFLHGLWFSLYD
jgi:hypothetical protein